MSASVKHCGGSVLVWGCVSASGVGNIVQIDAIMNAEKYRQFLIYLAIPSGFLSMIAIPSTLLMQ